jgi:hypothetical protein
MTQADYVAVSIAATAAKPLIGVMAFDLSCRIAFPVVLHQTRNHVCGQIILHRQNLSARGFTKHLLSRRHLTVEPNMLQSIGLGLP